MKLGTPYICILIGFSLIAVNMAVDQSVGMSKQTADDSITMDKKFIKSMETHMKNINDVRIRDSFILPVAETKTYYLYGTANLDGPDGRILGFDCFRSRDLEQWTATNNGIALRR